MTRGSQGQANEGLLSVVALPLLLHLHLLPPPKTKAATQPLATTTGRVSEMMMLSFENVPEDDIKALLTPMHCILPAGASSGTSAGALPTNTIPPWRSLAPALNEPAHGQGALFIGSMEAALDGSLLRKDRITHLVQVLETPWAPQPEFHAASDSDEDTTPWEFKYHRVDIEDRPSAAVALSAHLPGACDYIGRALGRGEGVLVHCQQGVSRSAAVVIAFLIRDKGMSYDDALAFVKERRSCIKPNAGFVQALRDWEGSCRATKQKPRANSEGS
ncbi:Dual specificity catalytic domain-containing protein [Mycena chlorophos]|uniref:protein-tyrosine-phosphatase n=1 Tax=Mycena chlorophos TaxID=658473 RepID=A0A8H6SIG5_MYCCL|nr:Dual specificity catalytic domain-containing protein [Mycena chlorophos]